MSNPWFPGRSDDDARDRTDAQSDGRAGESAAPQNPYAPAATPQQPADTEPTRTLPPQERPAAPAPAAGRRPGAWTAGVLVGALLVGGAAGFGGAAAWDTVNPPTATSPDTSSGSNDAGVEPAASAQAPAGSIEKVAQQVLPSVVQINVSGQAGQGSGSGVVLSKDGTILTNNHVVEVAGDSGTVTVALHDGRTAEATVVGTDPVTDIAVIKAKGLSDLTPASIGRSSQVRVGQEVVAIGSPYGLDATVTSGIVSALDRAVSVPTSDEEQQPQNPFGQEQPQAQVQSNGTTYPAIQTDAAINPGNSGGPLVDLSGRVIGINSSIRSTSSSADSEAGSIGLGFAIPIDAIMPIVEQLESGDTATHARLGISVSDPENGAGAAVKSVESGAAADDAGLEVGDVITRIDGQPVPGSDELVATVRGHRPGEKVTLTYTRDGATSTVTATLGSDEASRSS